MSQAELFPEVAPVSPFQFQNHPIRTQLEGDTLWFAARDVCEALTIKWNGRALSSIPSDWQGLRNFLTPSGNQQLKVILEPAVYKLAFRSNKPEADAFTNWIASEVVPSIRKTGRYEVTAERSASTSGPSPLSRRTDPERKQLTAIINTWVGMAPIHYAAARAQVNAHFGVTGVDKLTVAQVKEAIQYVQGKIDALPAAPSALPAAPSIVPAVEAHLATIRAHAREIMDCERRMYFTLRDTLPPLRGVTRPLALCLYESMDAGSVLLDAALKQVENNARLVIEYAHG